MNDYAEKKDAKNLARYFKSSIYNTACKYPHENCYISYKLFTKTLEEM